jgi:hypothetical protein
LIVTAVFTAANWQLLAGKVYETWDAYGLGSPSYSLLADFIRSGRFLYWDPWLGGGSPDFAIAGSGAFSPDLLLLAAIIGPGGRQFVFFWMLVWLAGGLGMLLLTRHLRAPVWGGLVISLGFLFSGFYTGHSEHTAVLYSYSYLPFIIWRLDAALLPRRMMPAFQAGVLWGCSALAGYPALTVATVGLITVWTVGRCLCAKDAERARDWKHALLTLITVGVVGVIVLSPSYVSAVYEGRGYSDRSEALSRAYALDSNALHPGALATLTSPSLIALKLADRSLWSYTDVSSLNLYTGSVTILLALLALVTGSERRWRWYLLFLALAALAFAMSRVLPFRGWAYDFIPPTRYFRHASMLRGYFLFLLCVLAAIGARECSLQRWDATDRRNFGLIASCIALIATVVFVVLTSVIQVEQAEWLLAGIHLIFAWGGLTFLALKLRRPETRIISFLPVFLIGIAVVDGIAAYYFSRGTIYREGPRPELPQPATSSIVLGQKGFARALGSGTENINLFFKTPTLNNYAPFKNRFHEALVALPLRKMALGENRIWFAPAAPEVVPGNESFGIFVHRIEKVNAPIILRHSRSAMLEGGQSSDLEHDAIRTATAAIQLSSVVVSYLPDELVLDVIAPENGWLMVTDRWARSWKATVNGAAQTVWGADFIFRAVPVVKGNNRVAFTYQPMGLPGLVILSWSTIAVVVFLSFVPGIGKLLWRRPPPQAGSKAASEPEVFLKS